MEKPYYFGFGFFYYKKYTSYGDETLKCVLRAQSTHRGQFSDRSVANFMTKSSRKKYKEMRAW